MLASLLIGYGLSFVGSMPFGIINMAVAHTAIHKGLKPAVTMALAASLIEYFQVYIALKFTWLFAEGGMLGNSLQCIAVIVFFAAGIYFLFFAKPASSKLPETSIAGRKRSAFFKGLLISSLNVMAIPYWIFYGSLLAANELVEKSDPAVMIFSLGAMLGGFTLFVAYAFLGVKVLRQSEKITGRVNTGIGVILIGFGIYQIVKLING